MLHRRPGWSADRGVIIHRVLSGNGSADRSFLRRDTCTPSGSPQRTRRYRPQTNGKIEGSHGTLGGWAFDL